MPKNWLLSHISWHGVTTRIHRNPYEAVLSKGATKPIFLMNKQISGRGSENTSFVSVALTNRLSDQIALLCEVWKTKTERRLVAFRQRLALLFKAHDLVLCLTFQSTLCLVCAIWRFKTSPRVHLDSLHLLVALVSAPPWQRWFQVTVKSKGKVEFRLKHLVPWPSGRHRLP